MFDFDTPIEKDTVLNAQWKCPVALYPPDLSQPFDDAAIENLSNIVQAGKAQDYLSLHDELLIPYGDIVMPFEVVGFTNVVAKVNGGDQTISCINLLAKYTSADTTAYADNANSKYSNSILRAFMTITYQGRLLDSFVNCLAETRVQTYSKDKTTDVIYDKVFPPSYTQLGAPFADFTNSAQEVVDGPKYTAFQNATITDDIKYGIDTPDTAQPYWTRSICMPFGDVDANSYMNVTASGYPGGYLYSNKYRVVGACNFVGILPPPEWDVDNPTLEGLNAAVKAGNYVAFPVGTEIPDTYDGQSNPLIVAQYLDNSNNSSYGGAEGVILVRKYVEPTSQTFNISPNYIESDISIFLNGTYLNNCSTNLKSILSQISIPYYDGNSMSPISTNWFLMSSAEMMSNRGYSGEGIAWQYWKDKTGLTSPDYTANAGRIMTDFNGIAQGLWLRSRYNESSVCYTTDAGLISYSIPTNSFGVLPACFISKS